MQKLVLLFVVLINLGNIVAQTSTEGNTIGMRFIPSNNQNLQDFPLCSSNVPDCNLNNEAKRHMLMAEGMRETMDNTDDMKLVADEYIKALQFASCCPDIYYNLGLCYEEIGKKDPEQFYKAIECYEKYLQLNPNAKNNGEIEDLVYKIEGKYKLATKEEMFRIGVKYMGGVIAYIDKTGHHGLIAAPFDQSNGIEWMLYRDNDDLLTFGTETAIGMGMNNTNIISRLEEKVAMLPKFAMI